MTEDGYGPGKTFWVKPVLVPKGKWGPGMTTWIPDDE